jgi:hypothetical protein
MKATLFVLTLSLFTVSSTASFAAQASSCPDLTGRYSLDAHPTANSTFLVVTQTGCAQIDMTWFIGLNKSTEYLRPVDGQMHAYGTNGDFTVTERWGWNGAGLELEQDFTNTSDSTLDSEDATYSLDAAGNLSETAVEFINGVATDAGSGTYYRVK